MSQRRLICDFIFKSFIILQLLSWNVKATWTNNHTLIKMINDMKTTWTAGENKMLLPSSLPHSRPGKDSSMPTLQAKLVRTPDSFDARQRWKHCRRTMLRIRVQGNCGSCWAHAAASVLSDRICIATRGSVRVHLSAEDFVCCSECMTRSGKLCDGGLAQGALYFWMKHGIVTGGEVDSKEGCKPYSRETYYNGTHVPCTRRCTNKKHYKEYEEDKYTGKMVYWIKPDEEAIKSEIFTHGPVLAAGVDWYTDLEQYIKGIYQHKVDDLKGGHALKILGWGEDSGVKYWLVANTWGTSWGLKGFGKFLRGENECSIEYYTTGARMFVTQAVRGRMRKISASSGNKRGSFLLQKSLTYAFVMYILRHCINIVNLKNK